MFGEGQCYGNPCDGDEGRSKGVPAIIEHGARIAGCVYAWRRVYLDACIPGCLMPDALFICLIDARLEKRQREHSPLINVASERVPM